MSEAAYVMLGALIVIMTLVAVALINNDIRRP
jgi:hypothetical protein